VTINADFTRTRDRLRSLPETADERTTLAAELERIKGLGQANLLARRAILSSPPAIAAPVVHSIPHAAPVGVAAVAPLLWIVAWLRRRAVLGRRRRLGLCAAC